jgi:hypothetical protein
MTNASASLRVVSKRKERGAVTARPDELVIDGDRSNPVLGNRHILHDHRDPVERDQVIAAYGRDLAADIDCNGPMSRAIDDIVDRLHAGRKVALRCWCANSLTPRPCHLDLVRDEALRRFGCTPVSAPQPLLRPEQSDVEI